MHSQTLLNLEIFSRFVRFKQKSSASLAIEMFDDHAIGSKFLKVKMATRTPDIENKNTNSVSLATPKLSATSPNFEKDQWDEAAEPSVSQAAVESNRNKSRGRGRLIESASSRISMRNSPNISESSSCSRIYKLSLCLFSIVYVSFIVLFRSQI